jgi:drug/metabolite transporter (DMT)-like permease
MANYLNVFSLVLQEMEKDHRPSKISIVLAFLAIYIIWGSTYLGIKYAIESIPPLLMSGFRYAIAGLVLFVFASASGAERPKKIHWKNTTIIGSLLFLVGNGAVSTAETLIPSGIAALIVCSVPIWFALFGWLFFKKGKPGFKTVIGIIIGVIGIFVLFAPDIILKTGLMVDTRGIVIITLGSIGWSFGSLFASKAKLPASNLLTTGMQMLTGGALLLIAGTIKGEWADFHWNQMSANSIVAMGYLIIFGSMVAFSAYTWLIKVSTPSLVSTYAYVNPVIAVLLGWLFRGETIDRFTIIGSAIIVIALILITYKKAIPIEEVPE